MEDIKLTVEELREYEFCKELNEKQISEVADFLAEYAIIIYKALTNNDEGIQDR